MGNWGISLFLIALVIIVIIFFTQKRFKNQMLCRFRRPNHMVIERWVPLYSKFVVFDNGKYGVGRYIVDPTCIQTQWYDRGFSKLFPTLIPTLDFRYNAPYPINPETFDVEWKTPDMIEAAWQEHNAQEFAKGVQVQGGGKKSRLAPWLLPIVACVLIIAVGFILFQQIGAVNKNFTTLQQQINTLKP
jgi:hypothetical protein